MTEPWCGGGYRDKDTCLVYQASIHMQFQGWIEGWIKLISLYKFRFMDGPGLNEVRNDPTQYHGIMLIQ